MANPILAAHALINSARFSSCARPPWLVSERMVLLSQSDSTMPLNSVSVDLSDGEHTQMDGLVLSSHPPVYPPMLLMLVVSESDGLLDQRYCDVIEAKNLLAKYPELGERLMTAHSARSFKDIRTLGMLFISKNPGNVKACRVLFRNTSTAEVKKTCSTTSNSR